MEPEGSYQNLESIEVISPFKEVVKKSTVCDHCGKVFLNPYTLSAHRDQVHFGIKTFKCSICNSSFPTAYKLKRHHMGVHSDARDFHCDTCGHSFKTRDMLLKHQRTHNSNKEEFSCIECSLNFKYKSGLDYHMRMKHRTENPPAEKPQSVEQPQCLHCLKTFSSHRTLTRHMKTHKITKISCDFDNCGMNFINHRSLQKHRKDKHSISVTYVCSYCKKEYKSKQNFGIHLETHEMKDEMVNYEFLNEDSSEEIGETMFEPTEALLRKIDSNMVSIEKIEEFEENEEPLEEEKLKLEEISDGTFQEISMIEEENFIPDSGVGEIELYEGIISETLETTQFEIFEVTENVILQTKIKEIVRSVCHECGSTFQNRSHLKRHQQRKHQRHKYKLECDICGSKFLLAYDLKRHMVKHSSKREFACTECDRKFKTEHTLRCHTKVLHSGVDKPEKKFSCHMCDRSYFHQRHLEYHMRRHTEDYRYSCTQCEPEKMFHYADAVKWHEIRHHGKPAPFTCSFEGCKKTFIHEKSWRTHESEHNPESGSLAVECPICNKTVSEKRHLKRHIRSHNTKRFQCNCGVYFQERFQFTKHKQNCETIFALECQLQN